jgi:Family of unknown function (DUF5302)
MGMTKRQPSEPANPPEAQDDELHRRFREALDRKRNRSTSGAAGSGEDQGAKSHGTTGPAKQQRTFRRKSGG